MVDVVDVLDVLDVERNRLIIAGLGIVALFAVGLGFYFVFSAGLGDGLESTLERAGLREPESIFKAPLDYGDNYPVAFLAGITGFVVVLLVVFCSGKLLGRKNAA